MDIQQILSSNESSTNYILDSDSVIINGLCLIIDSLKAYVAMIHFEQC